MGRRIVYCETCGVRLSEEDFRLGKAAHHLRRPFCAACKPPTAVEEDVEQPAWRIPVLRMRSVRRLRG